MFRPTAHTDPAVFTLRELERHIVRSRRLAVACQLTQDLEQSLLHSMWMDILLDEWSRRRSLQMVA